jgi:hypothetical protein
MLSGQRSKKMPGIHCPKCDTVLPLHLPSVSESCTTWICTKCGTTQKAALNRSESLERLQQVRPARIEFDDTNLGRPPEAIAEFIAKMMRKEHRGSDKRGSQRRPVVVPIPVIELDENLAPTGNVHMAVTRDISSSGVSLLSTRAANSPFIAVELSIGYEETIQAVVRVSRCRPLRCFYEIAGPFFTVVQEYAADNTEESNASPPMPSQSC